MINKYQNLFILGVILILAVILRFYHLSSIPVAPDWDELSHGYNAYSIMLTGKDEYGVPFPVVLRSFGDYKPALYTYLIIPCIKLFGLTIFAVRFPSAFIGVLAVLLTYFLVKELFKKEKLALLSAFFLAISPWHIQFTHVAFEASVGMALVTAMVLFFIKGFKHPWLFSLSTICAALALYAYQSEKVFTPLLFIALIVIYFKPLKLVSKKYLTVAVVVGIIFALPMLLYIFSNRGSLSRLQQVSALSNTNPIAQQKLEQSSKELLVDKQHHDYLGEVLDNRRYDYAKTVVAGYISHFNFNWLFIEGDSVFRHQPPEMGHLYLWDLPFLLIGLYVLLFGPFEKRTKYLLITWLLLTPVPPSITTEVPHSIRTIHFLPILQICIALGFITFLAWVKNYQYTKAISIILIVAVICALLFNITYYLDQYYVQYGYFNSQDWQYGSKEAAGYVKQHQHEYKTVYVDNRITYIFFLFYMQYPPALYQQTSNADHNFSNIVFKDKMKLPDQLHAPGNLLAGMDGDFPKNSHIIKTINYLDGTPAIEFYQP